MSCSTRNRNCFPYFHPADGKARFIPRDHDPAFASVIPPYTLPLSPDDFERGLDNPVNCAGGTTIPGLLPLL